MLTTVYGAKCVGIDAVRVSVEVDIRGGVGIHLVGLADTAVKESLLRTVTALQALGYHIPGKKIVINLAPADLHKNGSGYDLPIALGIIAASEQRSLPLLDRFIIMGELGLDGTVRDIPGALPFAEMAVRDGFEGAVFPVRSALEAAEFSREGIYGVRTLDDVVSILSGGAEHDSFLIWNTDEFRAMQREKGNERGKQDYMDFSEIVGQQSAKRAAEIACGGNHNLLLVGPPGVGKSSIAKAMAGILPPMTREEALLTSKIYSIAMKGSLRYGLIRRRPVRSPHYSASMAAMVGGGGGDGIIPGEVSLAQNGILFLDEFGQMSKSVIEALRGPLEDRKVTISRLKGKIEYPSSFMLVAASNPCPCGFWGEGDRCTCTPSQRQTYLSRLSGPVLDRVDLQTWVHNIDPRSMSAGQPPAETSAQVAARVAQARKIQYDRLHGEGIFTNAEMNNRLTGKFCPLSAECREALEHLTEKMGLSMRAYFKVIRVARTIADLEGSQDVEVRHLMEAAGFRFLDRQQLWK